MDWPRWLENVSEDKRVIEILYPAARAKFLLFITIWKLFKFVS